MVEWLAVITALLFGIIGFAIAIGAASSAGLHRRQIDRLQWELGELRRGLVVSGAFVPPMPMFPQPFVAPPAPIATPVADMLRPQVSVAIPPPQALPAPAEAPATPAAATPAAATFEERVALVWFTRIGAIILLVGVGFFYNYAADSGWLDPTARLLLGAGAGLAIVGAAELAKARTRPMFLHVLTGAGLGILYLVAWASHVLYGLTPPAIAFGAFATITLAGGALAVRNRAELVLVFSLAGGFLAPVLLSTDSDRPLALFAYLLVLTGLAFAASLRLRFQIAIWVAVAGTSALTIGWFATRFGADYASLASRWPVIVGTAAVAALWVVIATRARATMRTTADGLVLAALVFAHGAAAAIFHDAPALLGVVATGLAGIGVVAILRTTHRALVCVPLAATTLALAAADHGAGSTVATLVASGAAMAVYVVALLRGEWADGRKPGIATLVMVGWASGGFAIIAAIALFGSQPYAFALVLLGLSLGQVVLAIAAGRPLIALVAAAASLLGLAVVGLDVDGGARFSALAIAWAAIYVFGAAYELFALESRPGTVRLATVSLAALVLPLLCWTTSHGPITGADGLVLVGLGLLLIDRQARGAGTILIGEGVGLLAIAVAVECSAGTTVMVWAVMAAVVVALAAAARDGRWLIGGVTLFGVTTLVALPDALQTRGDWHMAFVVNPRFATLAVTAVALLASAYTASRARTGWFPAAAKLLAIAGHVVMVLTLLVEAANVVRDSDRLLMIATLILAVYAGLLIAVGFSARDKLHRYLGLGLFAITLLKLALVDVWSLSRVYQMAVLLGVGALLVAAGFAYARFGRRLVALLRS